MKNLFFFANPFGYGPTATIISILREFKGTNNIKLHFVGNGLCEELFDIPNVNFINSDQRDEKIIKEILKSHSNSYIISSLNRFATRVAYDLKIHNCFIDTLTYLWDKIPDDYMKSDIYFATDFPTVSEKIKNHKNAHLVPIIVDKYSQKKEKYGSYNTILQLGGLTSPLSKSIPKDYLDIIIKCLNALDRSIFVAAGNNGTEYLKNNIKNKLIKCESVKKSDFIGVLRNSNLLLTTPGLHTSTEAFYNGIPTNFMLPTNLSQWENYNIFNKFQASGHDLTWEGIIDIDNIEIKGKSEYDAIKIINSIAKNVKKDKKLMNKTIETFENSISNIPDTEKQKRFLKKFGDNGANVIFNTLCKEWTL